MEPDKIETSTKEIKQVVESKIDIVIREMYGIISAGGRGKRLMPRTLERPKPLLEIGSAKKPLMYWSMLPMILGGVSRFVIGVRYGASKIEKVFGNGRELSKQIGRKVTIDYIEEPEPLGRAGFIKYGLEKGVIESDKPAIIFNASDILRVNLRNLLRHYIWGKTYYGFEVVQVYTSGFKARYGIGKVDYTTFQVIDFEEKPLFHDLANTACYIIHGRLKDFKQIKKIPSNPEDELVPKWLNEKTLAAYIIHPDDLISIKFEKDLEKADEMDLDYYIKSAYK